MAPQQPPTVTPDEAEWLLTESESPKLTATETNKDSAAKPAADAVAVNSDDGNSKVQRSKKPAKIANKGDKSIVHHRYGDEQTSDLVITLQDKTGTLQHHHLHQQSMAKSCMYFASRIDDVGSAAHATMPLPKTFTWTVQELQQWLDMCYGKYDSMLETLAYTKTVKAFMQLVFSFAARLTVPGETGPSGAPVEWLVVSHQETGTTSISSMSQCIHNTHRHTVKPWECVLRPRLAAFAAVAEPLDLLKMFSISHFFQHAQLVNMLTKVILKFVEVGTTSLNVDVVLACGTLPAGQLQAACIDRLVELSTEVTPYSALQLKRLSPDLLAQLLLVTSNQLAAKTQFSWWGWVKAPFVAFGGQSETLS